jgi:transcriptional regulator with XRE-family HTH domain
MGTAMSLEEAETRVGSQLRTLRLARGWDQAQLAAAAGVSLGAVRNLELGRGSTLKTLSAVVIALGRGEWMLELAPTPTVSPIEILRQGRQRSRQRVYRPRREH